MSGVRERLTTALTVLSLGALGSLVVHQLGYSLVRNPGIGHEHLGTQWAVITPLAVLVAVATVLRQAYNLGVQCPTTGVRLGGISAALFVVQEMVEGLLAGGSAVGALTSATTIAGVLLAPMVGMVIAAMLRRAAEVVARFVSVPRFVAGALKPVRVVATSVVVGRLPGCTAVPRGPPVALFT